jgi:hypothetical protein
LDAGRAITDYPVAGDVLASITYTTQEARIMEAIPAAGASDLGPGTVHLHGRSAASWGAIFAGAFVAVAATVVLVSLGTGFGFASISPWTDRGISIATFSVTTAIWLIVTQWLSAALGGYIAGRLRTRWIGTHTHEVFFRDTAHGLVTWALATLVVASIAASSVASLVGGGVHAAAQVTGGAATGLAAAAGAPAGSYGVDKLFRSSTSSAAGESDMRAEATHILANAVTSGSVPEADQAYLASRIAQKTGATPDEAKRRVDEFVAGVNDAKAKMLQAADAARKAGAEAAIYTALSMLVGAFIASVSAALGGRLRDLHI